MPSIATARHGHQVAAVGPDRKWSVLLTLEQPKVYCLAWSPRGGMLATWEQYTTTAGKDLLCNINLDLFKVFVARESSRAELAPVPGVHRGEGEVVLPEEDGWLVPHVDQ